MASASDQSRQALFILGMHRSGTSAAARMCNLLGFELGYDLLDPRDDNKTGFWENAILVGLHEKAFDELGADWSDYIPFEPDWTESETAATLARDLESACKSQFAGGRHWCIKDPRVSRLFPVWRTVCDRLNVKPYVVIMFRHPGSVAASIYKRNGIAHQDTLLAWLRYNLEAIASSDNLNRIFVGFDTFQSSWRTVAESISQQLELEWPVEIKDAADQMMTFLDPSMVNHDLEKPLHAVPEILQWCSDLFDAMRDWEAGRHEDAEREFDRIRGELAEWDRKSEISFETIRSIRRRNAALAHVEDELVTKNEIISEREAWIDILKDEVVELDQLRLQLDQIRRSLSWKITWPLRYSERFIKRVLVALPYKLFSFCRTVYRQLPLPHPRKIVLRALFFRVITFLRLSPGTKIFSLPKKIRMPDENDREIDFRFVEYRSPKVSIIIPVYNEVHYTINCLRSIARNMPHTSFEVIVADDRSSDDTYRTINQIPGVRYFRNRENLGFLRNCNNAAEFAKGEYIFLLNNDTYAMPGFLDELVREMDEHPDVGLVGSKIIFPDGVLQEAGGIVWQDASGWNVGRGNDPNMPEFNYRREVDYCSGCSIMIRKRLWDELGGFDERFVPAYYEDTDIAFEIRRLGYKTVYQPMSEIVHFEGISSGTDITAGVKQYQITNQEKFLEKWKSVLSLHGTDQKDYDIARERQVNRRILIIDSVTPTPDQDAGSLRTYNLIRMLIELGSKVTFIPEDNIAYMEEFTPRLQRMGVECLYYPYITSVQRYLRSNMGRFDAVFLERGPVAHKYIGLIKSLAPDTPVFFDTHDLHYLRMSRQAKIENSNSLASAAESMQAMEYGVMNQCDCTIVVSQFERQVIEEEAPHIRTEILPLFMENEPLSTEFEDRSGMLFIGGFRHQPNGDAVHYFVQNIWPLVQRELPDATFHVIGAEVPNDIADLASENIFIEGFVADLRPLFSRCKLSVAPLRFGAGVKGKIGTALAYGLPSVISPIAAEGSGLEDGFNVLVAEEPEHFARQIVQLYKDKKLWESISANGLKFIEDNYSLAVNQERIAGLLDEYVPVQRPSPVDKTDEVLTSRSVIRDAALQ